MASYLTPPLSTTPEDDALDPLLVDVAGEAESYRFCLLSALALIRERDHALAIKDNQIAVLRADDARLQEVIGNLREELRRCTARQVAA